MIDELKYSEILAANNNFDISRMGEKCPIKVLSNVIVQHLNSILEYHLRLGNVNAQVKSGNYDNILQDCSHLDVSEYVVIFWEAANITEGFYHSSHAFNKEQINDIVGKVLSEIDLVLNCLKDQPLILFNKFSSIVFNHHHLSRNNFDQVCDEVNSYLHQKSQEKSNLKLIDIDKVLAQVSIDRGVDFKYFYTAKSLYTVAFYKNYVKYIKPLILAHRGKVKKMIVLDCDNTLWKGVLGEDGIQGIDMSAESPEGSIYSEVQNLILEMNRNGALIGLCSKNNFQDVQDVIEQHPHMKIKDEYVTIKKINWLDKVTNLRQIAEALNIGLDSLVFVDDSDFEATLVRKELPEVEVIQVPPKLYEYPSLIRESMGLFQQASITPEDQHRTLFYKDQGLRDKRKLQFKNMDEYLKSLNLQLTIQVNDQTSIPRISQLTMKTNQFNLTTKRYSESDISKFVFSNDCRVFSFKAADHFGDYGLTGVAIIKLNRHDKEAQIDSLLMSCRVIGRNLELVFFDFIVAALKKEDVGLVKAEYIKTMKNEQVSHFYNQLGFEVMQQHGPKTSYALTIDQYQPTGIQYIGVKHGG